MCLSWVASVGWLVREGDQHRECVNIGCAGGDCVEQMLLSSCGELKGKMQTRWYESATGCGMRGE